MGIGKISIGGLKQTQITPVAGVISPTDNNSGSPMKVGDQSVVKTPKAKKAGSATDKPSVFFKNEEFQGVKKPSIHALRKFLEKQRSKKGI